MNIAIQSQALALPNADRASLALKLLESLDDQPCDAMEAIWLQTAQQRASQIDTGVVQLVPYDQVRLQAQALCK